VVFEDYLFYQSTLVAAVGQAATTISNPRLVKRWQKQRLSGLSQPLFRGDTA
jgi:hypothetical protein